MENINFSLIELKEETFNDDSHYDIEHWKLYYSTNYTIQGVQQILQ